MWSVFKEVQSSPVAQLCPTLCDPMDCSTPGLPVHHQLPEFTQAHVHRVADAIQPSHPLSSPSPLAFNKGFVVSYPFRVTLLKPLITHQEFTVSQVIRAG